MSFETIARRYAGALADVVVKAENSETIKSELNDWQTLINSSNELKTAFGNPSIAQASKEKVLEILIERSKPSPMTANFLRVLLRNSRLVNLDQINSKLADVLEERSGVTSGTVLSARPLDESEKAAFAVSLKKSTNMDVRLTFEVDQSLIGGAITRVGSTVYDGSVKSQLVTLKDQMIKKN